jgi:uncharacterized protein
MKKTLIAGLAILLVLTSLDAQVQTRTLSIMETAEISISPDLCIMTILVETQDNNRNKAYNDNKEIMDRIITAVKDNEIEARDIQTTHYTVSPVYHSTLLNRNVFDGYKISTGLKVKIRDFTKILPLMDAVILAGATRISNVVFTLDDPKKHETEVREKAMKLARNKAEQIATLSGVSLGKPISISEFPPPQSITYDPYSRVVKQAAGATGLHIQGGRTLEEVYVALEPGEINLPYTVYITYELE